MTVVSSDTYYEIMIDTINSQNKKNINSLRTIINNQGNVIEDYQKTVDNLDKQLELKKATIGEKCNLISQLTTKVEKLQHELAILKYQLIEANKESDIHIVINRDTVSILKQILNPVNNNSLVK